MSIKSSKTLLNEALSQIKTIEPSEAKILIEKDNCNLMHSYCNSSMERPYRGCYLFNCSRSKCSCKSDKKKVFEKIDHPENLDINKKRMFLIMESFYKIKINRKSSYKIY